jgi:hypothetical protein
VRSPAIWGRFDFGSVIDKVDSRVRSLEYEVTAFGGLFLSMHKDSAFQSGKTSKVEHGHLKALIGDEGAMSCQSPLPVSAALHGS